MRRVISVGVALGLILAAPPPVYSQTNQLFQGTQIRLVLQHSLSTSVAREGDPFTAVVAEPVYVGGQLILPAGAIVHGEVGNIERPRRFALFRGQAMMMLHFRSIELDHREIPAAMSILSIHETSAQGGGRLRKDLRTEEGTLIQARRDVGKDVVTAGLATGGGTLVGAIFSHAMRGFALGLVGGATYIMVKKGKQVELPAQTGFLVRLDTTITLPAVAPTATPYTSGQP